MNHPTTLQYSMHADNALDNDEALIINKHLKACSACQIKMDRLLEEKQLITDALYDSNAIAIPAFKKPSNFSDTAIAAALIGVTVYLVNLLWISLHSDFTAQWFSWLPSSLAFDGFVSTMDYALSISQEGTTMLNQLIQFVFITSFTAGAFWLISSRYSSSNSSTMKSLCFSIMVIISTGFFTPQVTHALDIRNDEKTITIANDEIINDTVIASGNTIIVDGTINGDLIAFAERVIINGVISGNLFTFTRDVTVSGQVKGSFLGAARTVELIDANISGDVWGFSRDLNINRQSVIKQNLTMATEKSSIAGSIGKDLTSFSHDIELSGSVSNDFEALAESVSLLGNAYIGGDLNFHSNDEDNLQQSPTSTVIGQSQFLKKTDHHKHENQFFKKTSYIGKTLYFISTLIIGMILLWLIPSARNTPSITGTSGLKTAGIGFLSLISLPVIMLLLAITIIGIPLTIILFFAWVSAIYFAKIILASIIGHMVFQQQKSLFVTFLIGLIIVFVMINLPVIGGLFNFIITIVGLGLITQSLVGYTTKLNQH